MSEMIERVKLAIAEKLAAAIDCRAPYAKVMIEAAARAAIAAMREPTKDVLLAIGPYIWGDSSYPGDDLECWQDGIDAVLKEKP